MVVRTELPEVLGFFRANSRDVLGIEHCPIHLPQIEAVLATLRTLQDEPALKSARFVDVRAGTDCVLSLDMGHRASDSDLEALCTKLRAAHPELGIHLNVGGKGGVLSGAHEVVFAPERVTFSVDAKRFEVPPQAFFQLNTEMLEAMHAVMAPWVADEPVIDTFCGVGVHGLALGTGPVFGMDSASAAIEAARLNATNLGREARFDVVADDAASAAQWTPPWEGATVILNPARAGVSGDFLAHLAAQPARQLIYVSCNALTFLKDAERLAHHGWKVAELHGFELLPRTEHLELLARFERTQAKTADTVTHTSGSSVWIALVDGNPPHGQLPGGEVNVRRLRRCGTGSVVSLQTPRATSAEELAKQLRAWKHPVVGDSVHGNRSVNQKWAREAYVDEPMLVCVRHGDQTFDPSGFFVATTRIPRAVIHAT